MLIYYSKTEQNKSKLLFESKALLLLMQTFNNDTTGKLIFLEQDVGSLKLTKLI